MKRELTQEQITQLFDFTRKHYVEYYDVQVELVDHLASSIETEMEQNPNLSFEQALNKVFSGFGIFGFDGIAQTKGDAVAKQQRKLWQQKFLELLQWPNLIKSICIFIIIYLLFSLFDKESIIIIFSGLLVVWSLSLLLKEGIYTKRTLKKKLVLISHRYQYLGFCYAPIYIYQFFGDWLIAQQTWLLSLLFTVLILELIAYQITSKLIFKEAKELYPEAFKDFVVSN
jgi:hypothetical protein